MASPSKPPAAAPSRWSLRAGDLPPDSALRRDVLLRGIADNPAFRVAVWRRRRQGWPDVLAVAAFLVFLHGTIFIALLGAGPSLGQGFKPEIPWMFGFWSFCSSSVYMMLLFHGGWALEHGTKSPFHRPLLPPFIDDLARAGFSSGEIAAGIWGALASRGRRRALDLWALAVVAAGWGAAIAAPWQVSGMLLLAIGTAAYHLAAGRSGPRAALAQAASLVKTRHEQIDPGKKRSFGKPLAAPHPSTHLRFTIPAYIFFAFIIELVVVLGFWMLQENVEPDPALYCAIASAAGFTLGAIRGALARDEAEPALQDMAQMIGRIIVWQQPEAWKGAEEQPILWKSMPRLTGAGEESRSSQLPPPGRRPRPGEIPAARNSPRKPPGDDDAPPRQPPPPGRPLRPSDIRGFGGSRKPRGPAGR